MQAAEPGSDPTSTDLADLPLEELMQIEVPKVYSASKFKQKTTEAPSSVTVVTAEQIKRYGYRTLADVLRSIQGLHVSYDRNYAFLGSRGINPGDFNGRILLLVDGHRVNNNLTDGAYIGTAFVLDIDLIDRIEIIRGPGSVLYGNNAFFGVINVITRQGEQVDGVEGSGEYASFDTYKGRITYGKSFTNGLQLLLSGTLFGSEGDGRLFYPEFDTPSQNNGIADGLDDDSFGSFFGSLSYRDFSLQGAYIGREKQNPTAQFFTTFSDPGLRTIDERSYTELKYTHSFPEVVDVTAQAYYDNSEFEIGYPTSGTLFQEKDSGRWWGVEMQLNKRLWERHTLSVGGEYRDDFHQELRFSGQPTIHRDRQNYGFYVQGDFMVITNLHVDGGVRYDQYGSFDASFNPRVALIYDPVQGTTLKAIYGKAFRVPNFLELALSSDLDPEDITSYELVYEQQAGRNIRSSISGFYNQIDNLIIFESGSFRNFNVDAGGIEFALEGVWTNGIRGRLSYTYQHTEKRGSDIDLPDSPNHLVKADVSVPLYRDKVFAGLEFQFTGDRKTLDNTTDSFGQPVTIQGVNADCFGILNFTLFSRDLVKNLEMSASVYNLLDTRYSDPATRFHQQDTISQDGRTFRLKVTYRF